MNGRYTRLVATPLLIPASTSLSYTSSSASVEYVPPIDGDAVSACRARVSSCAERASISSGSGCAGGGGLSHCSPGTASVGDDSGGSVAVGVGPGCVSGESVGVGVALVSVGDGSVGAIVSVGDGSVGAIVSVGDGSVGAIVSVGDGHGPVGEGVGVGLGEVGEGEGLAVGAQVSVGGDVVAVGVGSICATARPPKEKPKAAVAASTARTQARRLTAIARRRAAVTRGRCGSITDPSSVRSRSSTLSRLPGHPQGPV
jgi:hypothetical protein